MAELNHQLLKNRLLSAQHRIERQRIVIEHQRGIIIQLQQAMNISLARIESFITQPPAPVREDQMRPRRPYRKPKDRFAPPKQKPK